MKKIIISLVLAFSLFFSFGNLQVNAEITEKQEKIISNFLDNYFEKNKKKYWKEKAISILKRISFKVIELKKTSDWLKKEILEHVLSKIASIFLLDNIEVDVLDVKKLMNYSTEIWSNFFWSEYDLNNLDKDIEFWKTKEPAEWESYLMFYNKIQLLNTKWKEKTFSKEDFLDFMNKLKNNKLEQAALKYKNNPDLSPFGFFVNTINYVKPYKNGLLWWYSGASWDVFYEIFYLTIDKDTNKIYELSTSLHVYYMNECSKYDNNEECIWDVTPFLIRNWKKLKRYYWNNYIKDLFEWKLSRDNFREEFEKIEELKEKVNDLYN